MCSLMHPSLQPWVGDLGPCVCLSMRVFASFGSLLPSFLTPLVPRIPNSLVIRLADTPCPPLCPLVVCVLCAGAPAPAPGPPGSPGTAFCPCLWDTSGWGAVGRNLQSVAGGATHAFHFSSWACGVPLLRPWWPWSDSVVVGILIVGYEPHIHE